MKGICKDKVNNIAIISESLDNHETESFVGILSKKLSEHYNVYLFLADTENIPCEYGGTIINIGKLGPFYEYLIKVGKRKCRIDIAISFSRRMNFANIRTKGSERVVIFEKGEQTATEDSKEAETLKIKRYYDYADEIVTDSENIRHESVQNKSILQEWLYVIEKTDRKNWDALALEKEMLDKAEKIAIYGIGYVGKSCFLRLSGEYRFDCFTVSKLDEMQMEYLGVPVKSIDELNPSDTTIVIGVGDSFQDEIVSLLKEKNFTKIVFPYLEPLEYEYYMNTPNLDIRKELILWYQLYVGKKLDLENPKTYNEKIQWLKLYDCDPRKSVLADKILVRDYVKEKIGENYLVPIIGVWNTFDEIDFSVLPNQFVLKCNHASGTNLIVHNKLTLNKEEVKRKFDKWLKIKYEYMSGFEMHYSNIKPRILAEKMLVSEDNEDLRDYKVFVFNGKAKLIQVDIDRQHLHRRNLYTTEWKYIPYSILYPTAPDIIIEKPGCLDEVLSLSEKLGKDFIHVRVDWYILKKQIYFGELTFTHGSGGEKFEPEEFNAEMGSWMKLPEDI